MACRAALRRLPLRPQSSLASSPISANPFRISCSPPRSPRALRFRVNGIHLESNSGITAQSKVNGDSSKTWKIKMLYDGECPLCMREVNMLKERNALYGAIKFVDISSNDYSPDENEGLAYETVMGRIHAILSDGTVLRDIEAFRKLYEEVGLGWVYTIAKYEPFATIASAIYSVWAKYRLQITGRPPLEKILETRKKEGEACSDAKICKM